MGIFYARARLESSISRLLPFRRCPLHSISYSANENCPKSDKWKEEEEEEQQQEKEQSSRRLELFPS
jgi:hypothetical protein